MPNPVPGRVLAVALLTPLFFACGGDDAEPLAQDAEVTLSNGTLVRVTAGAVELERDGRPLWASAGTPVARQFRQTWTSPAGIWDFFRRGETVTPFDAYRGVREIADGVELEYGATGSDAVARLRILPGDEPGHTVVRLEVDGMEPTSLELASRCDAEGSFHGFGEQYNATEQTGEQMQLFVSEQGIGRDGSFRDFTGDAHTTYFPMPYYLDARGFGVLVRTDHRVNADVCATDAEAAALEVVSGDPLEMAVFHGPTPAEVIDQLSEEVGRPALPPAWAWTLWVGSQGGREAVLDEAQRLRDADVPAGVLWVQDWTGIRMNLDGGFGVEYRWVEDPELYPDLAGMIDQLAEQDYRFLSYANPFIAMELDDHFPEMAERGLLIEDGDGEPYVFPAPNGSSSHTDFTDPEANDYVRDALGRMVGELGMDGWMADFGEWQPLDAVMEGDVDPFAYHNRYPIEWHRVNREVMDAERPDGDWVLFARSGWTGVQQHSMIHWVGDQEADWSETDGLPTVVPAMVNLGLAGVPYVTHDIAGFSGGPSTKELFMRWTELGAFTPVMRTHEGNKKMQNWSWDSDEETTAHFRRFARIHEALIPELEDMADEAQRTSMPMVRHLLLAFPDDREAWQIHDQYMLGDELLVAPVTEEGASTRSVYLPAGTWYHVFTGDTYEGAQRVEVDAPIGVPPVFSLGRDREDLRAIE